MPNQHLPGCPSVITDSARCTCEVDGVFCRCVLCRKPFSRAELGDSEVSECPNCKTELPPMYAMDDAQVSINWFELRILANFAEKWATMHAIAYPAMMEVVYAIAAQVEMQYPSYQPLTIAGELGLEKQKNPDLTVQGAIQPIIPKPRLH